MQASTNPRIDTRGRLLTGLTTLRRVQVLLRADSAICAGDLENFERRISPFTRLAYRLMARLWRSLIFCIQLGGSYSFRRGRCGRISPYDFDHDDLR